MSTATNIQQAAVDVEFLDDLFGERTGYLAMALGYDGYWTDKGTYEFREWVETNYAWPAERDAMVRELNRELATRQVDVYYCPALRTNDAGRSGFTNKKKGTNALPPNMLWADCDTTPDPDVLEKLGAVVVDSGRDGHQHVYVPLAESVSVATHRKLNKALAELLDGDVKWSDEVVLRVPGTLNHKTDPPGPVVAQPGPPVTPWDPDTIAHFLSVDLTKTVDPLQVGDVTPEDPPAPLPLNVMSALRNPDVSDRSTAVSRVVGACINANMTAGQALSVVLGYGPAVDRARTKGGNAYLAADVARMYAKFEKSGPQDLPPTGDRENGSQGQEEATDAPTADDEFAQVLHKRLLQLRADVEARKILRAENRAQRPALWERLVDSNDLDKIEPPTWLMREFIPEAAVGFIGGDTGTYKSFVSLSWACHLAAGTPWQDRPEFAVPRPVRGLYVAAEGAGGARLRVEAWRSAHGDLPRGNLVLYPEPIDLTDPDQIDELMEVVVRGGFGFVVIDTLARSQGESEDNSTTDFNIVFNSVAKIRDRTRATILFVDHSGHDGSRIRGAAAKGQNADFVIMATRSGDNSPKAQRRLRITKRKDLASEGCWDIRLHQVPGIGEHGSAYVELGSNDLPTVASPPEVVANWATVVVPSEIDGEFDRQPGANAARDIYRVLAKVNDPGGLTSTEIRKVIEEGYREQGVKMHSKSTWQAGFALAKRKGVVVEGRTSSRWVLVTPQKPS